MDRGITTGKCKDTADGSDKEGQPLGREFSQVEELGENFLRGSMIRHISQGDENREESQDMKNQNHALKTGKNLSSNAVDSDRKNHDSPEDKSSVPVFGFVAIVCEHSQALNQGAD
jgi:hypothetical protein